MQMHLIFAGMRDRLISNKTGITHAQPTPKAKAMMCRPMAHFMNLLIYFQNPIINVLTEV